MSQAGMRPNRYGPVASKPRSGPAGALERLLDALTRGRRGERVLVVVNTTRGQVAVPVRRRDLGR